jgi:hypothetical protein
MAAFVCFYTKSDSISRSDATTNRFIKIVGLDLYGCGGIIFCVLRVAVLLIALSIALPITLAIATDSF